jgi:hypothetical protein
MDVSVVSAKTNLSGNAYRQLENGTINMGKIKNFTEIPTYKRGNQQQAIRTIIFYSADSLCSGAALVSQLVPRLI